MASTSHSIPSKSYKVPAPITLGSSDLKVSRIGLGCWPMSGVSSVGIEDRQSVATIHAALDHGVNFFDTAYSYGYDGRSDRVLREALSSHRDKAIIAHKVGMHWDSQRQRVLDGSRATLLDHAQQCLARLGVEYVDLMYLHSPDPTVPIEESAQAIREICQRGWARYAGVSNVTPDQARRFASECPIVAIQPYFNMFQQDAVESLRPFVATSNIALVCYWVLMKGLLSGNLPRNHRFEPNDRRLTYPIFQGEAWEKAQNLLDRLRELSRERGCTVTQLVTAWSLAKPNVTVTLVGAKRPDQIIESAQSMSIILEPESISQIDRWLEGTEIHPESR